MDTKLNVDKEFQISKLRKFIYWPIRIVAIICAVLVFIYVKEYKVLLVISIGLVYINAILIVKYLVNSSRTLLLWSIMEKSVEVLEKESKSIEELKCELLHEEEMKTFIGKGNEKIIVGIEKILDKIEVSKSNVITNEKMNINLVSNVANKLDRPIDTIIDKVNELKVNSSDDKETLKLLQEKSNILKKLIDELFEAAKVASGDMSLEVNELDIVALLKQSLIEYKDNFDESGLILKVNLPKDKIFINCNGEKLWRVFDILIQNLIKHSLINSRVYVDLYRDEERVYLKLRNTSNKELNIKAEELVNVINQNNDENISGLGIEIAKHLVKMQNGKFDIDIDADLFTVEISFHINEEREVKIVDR